MRGEPLTPGCDLGGWKGRIAVLKLSTQFADQGYMTSPERAKAFAQGSARLALTILPLAVAAAGVAHGTTIVPTFNVTSASCPGGTVSNLPINLQTGIKLFTGTSCSLPVNAGVLAEGIPGANGALVLSASGTGSGIIPVSSIPINVIFTPTFTGSGTIDYSFVLDLNGSTNAPQLSGAVASGTEVNQSFNFNIGSNVTLSTWSVSLTIASTDGNSGTLGLTVPQNSIDINAPSAATPEPSSLFLFTPAAGLMFLRRRRR